MTHTYFSARAEGRISYGHLGRTNSCSIQSDSCLNSLIEPQYKILNKKLFILQFPRRSVVKYGRLSGSVRSSHQTVSDYTLRQWFPNTQQSRFLTACRRLEKLVLPSISDTSLSFILDDVKLAELSNNSFEWKNDILGSQNIFWPSHIFSGGQVVPIPGSAPLSRAANSTARALAAHRARVTISDSPR